MRALPALDDLKELLTTTEQCAARARVAKQQVQRFAQHYRMNVYAISPKALMRWRKRNRLPHGMRLRSTLEDPVSQARRHVAEAEARVERQEALVARLFESGKTPQLADQAKEILSTLKQTLRLARVHLDELELRK